MRLSWNEIRARAADFARAWADAAYEKGETQSFYNAFFEIFGVQRRTVARYEEHVQRLDNTSGFIDLFWPRVLLVEQKSAGRDLTAAREQAGTYFDAPPGLPASLRLPDVRASRPRRTRGDPLRARRPATARREVRVHHRRAAPHVPRSASGLEVGLGSMTCKVTFGPPVVRDRRVCSLVITVTAPPAGPIDQAGVGVGLVAEVGEPWRVHARNVQAAVESLGVTVQASALQEEYATPDDAARALEDLLYVADWSRESELATRPRRGGSPGRRYRQRLKARLDEWFSYEWPGYATGHAGPPVFDHGQEVAALTVKKYASYDIAREEVGIWRAPGAKLWKFNTDDVQVAVKRLTGRSMPSDGTWHDWTFTKPEEAVPLLNDLLCCHEWGERAPRTACGLTVEPWMLMEPEDGLPPRRGFPPCRQCVVALWGAAIFVQHDLSRRGRPPRGR